MEESKELAPGGDKIKRRRRRSSSPKQEVNISPGNLYVSPKSNGKLVVSYRDNFKSVFIRALNGLFGLTNKEMEMLEYYLGLWNEYILNNENDGSDGYLVRMMKSIFSVRTRESVKEVLGLNHDNLVNRYMGSLIDKGILIEDTSLGILKFHPKVLMLPDVAGNCNFIISFSFKND